MRNLHTVFEHVHDMICCMACVTQGQCLGRSPAHSSKHRPKHVFCKAWPITSTCCGTLSARVPFGTALIARGIAGSAGRRQRGTVLSLGTKWNRTRCPTTSSRITSATLSKLRAASVAWLRGCATCASVLYVSFRGPFFCFEPPNAQFSHNASEILSWYKQLT